MSQSRLSNSANETNSVRAHPRDRLRVRLEIPFPLRGRESPGVCQSRTPDPVSRSPDFPFQVPPRPQVSLEIMRAVGNAPWKYGRSGFATTARPVFRRFGPRYSHGPTVLKRRARSLLGVLRAPLLRRQPSIPLSPTCCHGHLECVRRASRGPSRQVSLAERGRGWPHKLA